MSHSTLEEILPVRIEVSPSASTLSLGEPVVLRYTFIGTQAEEVVFYMGRHKQHWITCTLEDAEGGHGLTLTDPRMRQGGIYTYGTSTSAARQAVEFVVVTRMVRPTHPGKYRLSTLARLPYAMKAQSKGVSPTLWEETFGTVLTQEDTFDLTFTALDPARLLLVAEHLAERVIREVDYAGNKMAFQALFSMPAEYVLPIWQAITTSEDMRLINQWNEISDELARLETIQSADLLAEMVWNPPGPVQDYLKSVVPPDLRRLQTDEVPAPSLIEMSNVWLKFNNMYFTADPALKQHLIELYKAYGRDVPRQPTMIID